MFVTFIKKIVVNGYNLCFYKDGERLDPLKIKDEWIENFVIKDENVPENFEKYQQPMFKEDVKRAKEFHIEKCRLTNFLVHSSTVDGETIQRVVEADINEKEI